MNLNWTAIIIAFVISIIMGIFGGLYLPKNINLIGPIIGGLIAGYIVDGSYTDGLVNGGVPAGIAGLISFVVIIYLTWGEITTLVSNLGYPLPPESFLIVEVATGFAGFAMYFVLGIIGAVIGVAIKNRSGS